MRIYKSNNDPIDFCVDCMPDEVEAYQRFGNVGDGPDSRGNCYTYDADHPPYDDGVDYYCYDCGKLLIVLPSSFWNWTVKA